MIAWKELARTAIVGTERQSVLPSPQPPALGAFFQEHKTANSEEEVLLKAAVMGTWKAAALQLRETPGLEPVPDVEVESHPTTKPKLNTLLQQMSQDAPQIAAEVLEGVRRAGMILSPELLPTFFELARRDKSLREVVSAVGGKRGAALARKRSDWEFLLGNATGLQESAWEGPRQERVAYLRELRLEQKEKARQLVQECWKGEQAANRRDFLLALEVGLGLEDEAFLESALDDKSKEVREAAQSLLARLPESAFVKRMTEHARGCLQVVKKSGLLSRAITALSGGTGTSFSIEAPSQLDSEAKRDGLELSTPKPTDPAGFVAEQRGEVLEKIIAGTPLNFWIQETGLNPEELIAGSQKANYIGRIIRGWELAAAYQHHDDWAKALVLHRVIHGTIDHNPGGLFVALPRQEQEWVMERAAEYSSQQYASMANLMAAPLSLQITRKLHALLNESITKPKNGYDYEGYRLIQILCLQGALEFYPQLVEYAKPYVSEPTSYTETWNKNLFIYELRHTLFQEIKS